MAGRGRGRGRGSMSFSVETLGFGRGEALPTASAEPPPLFPPLVYKPAPLLKGEDYDYFLAIKQELRRSMRESPYYIKNVEVKRDIERYSDKYQIGNQTNGNLQIDYSRLPAELKPRSRKKVKSGTAKPNVTNAKSKTRTEEIQKTLEALERKEASEENEAEGEGQGQEAGDEEGDDDEDKEGGEADDAEELDEDDLEDDTDYNQVYFDNGEHYGLDEDDDLEDGAVF